jgi:hypothetical protein
LAVASTILAIGNKRRQYLWCEDMMILTKKNVSPPKVAAQAVLPMKRNVFGFRLRHAVWEASGEEFPVQRWIKTKKLEEMLKLKIIMTQLNWVAVRVMTGNADGSAEASLIDNIGASRVVM